MAFLGACFVRRFSLNALSVPPLGQVQARFGWAVGLFGGSWDALGRSWGVLGRLWAFLGAFWALLERSWSLLGSLGRLLVDFLVDFPSIFGQFSAICFAFWEVSRERGYFTKHRKNTGKTIVFQRFSKVGG